MNSQSLSMKLLVMLLIAILGLGFTQIVFSQSQRNPVLEFCTGVN